MTDWEWERMRDQFRQDALIRSYLIERAVERFERWQLAERMQRLSRYR